MLHSERNDRRATGHSCFTKTFRLLRQNTQQRENAPIMSLLENRDANVIVTFISRSAFFD